MGETSERIAVCAGCGLIAPTERGACRECDAPLGAEALSLPRLSDGGAFWVAVRCRFECNQCGHRSPLNFLDADGSVRCGQCGLDQRFDTNQWQRQLGHAHAVGDLSGPGPTGRFAENEGEDGPSFGAHNPFAEVGVTDTWVFQDRKEWVTVGDRRNQTLTIRAAPGHPLCEHCATPLEVQDRAGDAITVRCTTCDTSTRYGIPKRVRKHVGGVLAPDHVLDGPEVRLDEEGGAVAIRCPECGAALRASEGSRVATCEFCRVTSRIAPEIVDRLDERDTRERTWWVRFEGASGRRKRVRKDARRAAEKARRRRERARDTRPGARGEGAPDSDEGSTTTSEEAPWKPTEKTIARSKHAAWLVVAVAVALALWLLRGLFLGS